MDLTDIAMFGIGLLSLGAGLLVMAWPTDDEIDVMHQVQVDQASGARRSDIA